ncbi:hypothetical protein PMAYCL1PPCAC_15472, partial [Pristionchus mayeri]
SISYLINLCNTIEITLLLFLSSLFFIKDFLTPSQNRCIQADSASSIAKALEIRLFKQAFSQSIPLMVTLICFAFVTPRLSDDFEKFLTTTFVWHVAHEVDGLIIDLFNTKANILWKNKNTIQLIGVSKSFALTT